MLDHHQLMFADEGLDTVKRRCMRRCCCVVPIRCGTLMLYIFQIMALIPFTLFNDPKDPTPQTCAKVLMGSLFVSVIIFFYSMVAENYWAVIAAAIALCPVTIFHAIMIYHYYPGEKEKFEHKSEETLKSWFLWLSSVCCVLGLYQNFVMYRLFLFTGLPQVIIHMQ